MERFGNDNYTDIINNTRTFVLDFSASWCGPCRKVEPVLEELSDKYPDLPFYKCDVGEEQQAAAHFNIYSVPTIIFFRDGQEMNRISGVRTQQFLEDEIQKLL